MVEVVLADQDAILRESAYLLVAWYNLSVQLPADSDALRAAADALLDNWHARFHDTGIKSLSRIPKLHRLLHVADSVDMYGPYKALTTERSESAHKGLKHMYRTYVSFLLPCILFDLSECTSRSRIVISRLRHVVHSLLSGSGSNIRAGRTSTQLRKQWQFA